MPYLIIIALAFGGGYFVAKQQTAPLTAGACLDAGTKSVSEKFDDIINIIKE